MIQHRRKHALLRLGVAIPFLVLALIWGSTWIVIKDQLNGPPPSWSVAYRFIIAAAVMFLVAARLKRGFAMTFGGHVFAFGIGITQFFFNFNFVYRAELHLTSGIVAVMFALLMVPNAVLGRIFLGIRITGQFVIGTIVTLVGIILLLSHESLAMPSGSSMGLGIFFTACGILAASVASVMQANETAQKRPLMLLLAWAMLWGALFDATFAWAVSGPPVFPADGQYWAGVAYLAIIGTVITFPLFFGLVRDLGPGRAAYIGVLVPVVAMAISTLFEGYVWSTLAMIGSGLAMIGLLIALRGREIE